MKLVVKGDSLISSKKTLNTQPHKY